MILMTSSLHHLTYEVDEKQLVQELEFWAAVGFCPCAFGPRRRSRKQPIIHWLTGGDFPWAIELLPVATPYVQQLGHVCFVVSERRLEVAAKTGEDFGYKVEREGEGYPNLGKQVFMHSPTGHTVELITNKRALKCGPPLQE